jgi:hypothetical protein
MPVDMPVGTFWSAHPDHSQVMLTDTVTIVLALSKGSPRPALCERARPRAEKNFKNCVRPWERAGRGMSRVTSRDFGRELQAISRRSCACSSQPIGMLA